MSFFPEEPIEIADALHVDMDTMRIPVLSKVNLLKNKESTGRPKDRLDADLLRGR
ncbi:MAG: hypothetical protein HYV27_05475 [Candidatus Hydrogenedentes bacterium]|nr:hypothetical protein [Candidatus Hydrogenedentota bacterium]